MAQAIAQKLLSDRGLTVDCRSAGLRVDSPLPLSREAKQVLEERGLKLEDHVSRPVTNELLQWADLIIPVTGEHAAYLNSAFLCKAPVVPLPESVGDPYGSDVTRYRQTADALERGILALWEKGVFSNGTSDSHS